MTATTTTPTPTQVSSDAVSVIEGLKAGAFLGGLWRDGSSERRITVTSAVDGTELRSFPGASAADVDEAYEAAAQAQKEGAAAPPA